MAKNYNMSELGKLVMRLNCKSRFNLYLVEKDLTGAFCLFVGLRNSPIETESFDCLKRSDDIGEIANYLLKLLMKA